MSLTSPLPSVPGADDVRALARSSPWRWRTARFTVRWTGALAAEPVRAWIARPASLRVERLDGTLLHAGVEDRGGVVRLVPGGGDGDGGSAMPERYPDAPTAVVGGDPDPVRGTTGASFGWAPWPGGDGDPAPGRRRSGGASFGWGTPPSDDDEQDEPVLRPDGLVARRPRLFGTDVDAPMYQDYRWVAMLDPVELAEAADAHPDEAEPATELSEIAVVDHHGRPAWEALVRTLPAYDPRCSCCPLLGSAAADAREAEAGSTFRRPEGFTYPDAHRVRLDVGTGICVYTEDLGGTRAGGHELVLEEVDGDMPADLFVAPRSGWSRR